jgi:alpha-glucosidase (family GH31 glycosyl hydrolase)
VAGTVMLEFPGDGRWTDAFDGSTYTGGTFKCTFAKGQTRLFVRDQAEATKP